MNDCRKTTMFTEFSYKMISANEIEWKFGCPTYEKRLVDWINRALYENKYPDFSTCYDAGLLFCHCRESSCSRNEKEIHDRLIEIGLWKRIEEMLSPVKQRVAAKTTNDGGIEVNGVKYPFLAGLGYMDDTIVRGMKKIFPNGYVAYSKHDDEYVCFLPDGSYKLLRII